MALELMKDTGFHATLDAAKVPTWIGAGQRKSKFDYRFRNHFHPYVGDLLKQLNKRSIDGLFDVDDLEELKETFFDITYQPTTTDTRLGVQSFPKEIDLDEDGAYSVYNWELLYHVPLSIAVHLSKSQRFAEAQQWFHYIFDPTSKDGEFWRFLKFRQSEDIHQVDRLLHLVSKPDDECTAEELDQKRFVMSGYETIRKNPFQPHAVARTRFLAYQYGVVFKYLDNLIAWGDSLFRQDTIETLNEATQVYVLAANILGPKPQSIPRRGRIRPRTYAQLRAAGIDPLGNALVELEGEFPFNLFTPVTEGTENGQTSSLFGIGRTLYFCVPRNDKLLGYWDTVADRLFKIRNCMNIEGVVRQLPLFQPPIDPGMLVKAAAAGIDISSLVSGLNQPLAPVRSTLLMQKALEICSEVRGLGTALLSAMEKKDSEAMGLLRQKHETAIQQLSQDVRYLHWKEAEAATESLLKARDSALERYRFYNHVLGGNEGDLKEVTEFALERRELSEENFDEVFGELVGQYAKDIQTRDYPARNVLEEGTLFLNSNEDDELNDQLPTSAVFQGMANINDVITALLYYIPKFKIDASYWGIGADTEVAGGEFLGNAGSAVSKGFRGLADLHAHNANVAAKTAGYERRAEDWISQSNLAARELMQVGRQIISSLIREQITRHDYEVTKRQIEHSQETDQFLRDKFTNEELYGWMQGELSKLYYEYYKFAFDIARKAELTMKHELMRSELDDVSFVKFNYWDGGRRGLLSGDTLHLDLKRMEMAYHDHNKREYELVKHVSLRQLNPAALLSLKATGVCEVTLPEWLFDMDTPGHYLRRIKSVSLSIPAVTGPYAPVNCTLSLLRSSLRRSPVLADGEYARLADEEDTRFVDYYGTIQSIVTSTGREDSGMFEPEPGDARFLPFEGHGAVSTWMLELPSDYRQFDYASIPDVVLHVRYTARQGGALLRGKAVEQIGTLVEDAGSSGLVLLFSLKHDFPDEWHRFVSGNADFTGTVTRSHFPYLAQGKDVVLSDVQLHAIDAQEVRSTVPAGLDLDALTTALEDDAEFQLSFPPDPEVLLRDRSADVFVLIRYTLE